MNYLEARNSGYPFNRRKYKDGWYIRDLRRNVDYAKMDLSQRFWTQADLEADDWFTEPIAKTEEKWFYLYCTAVSLIITLLLVYLTAIASMIIHLGLFIMNM